MDERHRLHLPEPSKLKDRTHRKHTADQLTRLVHVESPSSGESRRNGAGRTFLTEVFRARNKGTTPSRCVAGGDDGASQRRRLK